MVSSPPSQESEANRPESTQPPPPQGWLASIVESSDDAIVSKTLEGVVTTWNKGAERIFGYTSEEMVGMPITTIIPQDRLQEEPNILSRIRRGERVDHFETIRQRKDGTLIEVSVTISPVRDADNRVVGVSKIARDITSQKRFQRELVAAREAADQAKEMAEAANRAKDQFLSILSHELRTPLTPALGAVSYIESDTSLPPETREQLKMIRRNIETEARLVDDLLDLTRIARGKLQLHFEAMDVHAVIRAVLEMFQKEIDEKAIAVTLALRAKDFHIWADSGRFQQVLLNLMSNAIKFTPAEGSITLRTSNIGHDVEIEVADNGVGIDPLLMPKLFTPFEQGEDTTRRRFGGLGLGLSIIKSLMELHHGTVHVRSEGKQKGATFTLRLATVSAAREAASARNSDNPLINKYRILLVEDHADTRQVMTVVLRSFGCQVSVAGTVKEAMQLAEKEEFDLLVSDIGLPDGSGLDVMRHLSERQQVKAIAISGFGQEDDLRRSREAGFTTHLTKPVSIKALQEAIEKL